MTERFTPRLTVHPPASRPVRAMWCVLGCVVMPVSIALGVVDAWRKERGL